jgi:hypothetical protein
VATGPTVVTGYVTTPVFVNNPHLISAATEPEQNFVDNPITVTINGTSSADFCAAVSSADIPNVIATVNSAGQIVFEHQTGGDIYLMTEPTHLWPMLDLF